MNDGEDVNLRSLGAPELVIGLTIVAADASFPELATSVVAAIRGQRDIAIGNVVGYLLYAGALVAGSASGGSLASVLTWGWLGFGIAGGMLMSRPAGAVQDP